MFFENVFLNDLQLTRSLLSSVFHGNFCSIQFQEVKRNFVILVMKSLNLWLIIITVFKNSNFCIECVTAKHTALSIFPFPLLSILSSFFQEIFYPHIRVQHLLLALACCTYSYTHLRSSQRSQFSMPQPWNFLRFFFLSSSVAPMMISFRSC